MELVHHITDPEPSCKKLTKTKNRFFSLIEVSKAKIFVIFAVAKLLKTRNFAFWKSLKPGKKSQ